MRLLVLGGTAWLGANLVRAAQEAGHQVTCLARGTSGVAPDGAEFVPADRTRPGCYDRVCGRPWDLVIDLSRQPGQVEGAVTALADRAAFFVFVSSGNAYAEHRTPGRTEDAATLPPLSGEVLADMEQYGQAKVACERHVLRAFGSQRALIARVGLIGGPGDLFDRTGYWPLRFARPAAADGSVLVPNAPDLMTQVIDVRDLAAWLVDAGRRRTAGVFSAAGNTVRLADHLDLARSIGGHAGPVVAADEQWLISHDVQQWMGERSLPLWLSDADWRGFNALDSSRARAAGLRTRPLDQTLADTLAWELTRSPGHVRRAGLTDQDEQALLSELGRTDVHSSA